jgi:hypothetical protein
MARYVMDTLSRTRLVDKLLEAYIDWRESCVRANDAYRFWAAEAGPRRTVAFGVYMAALDAEEHAAEVYAGFVRCVEKLLWNEQAPAEPLGRPAWGDASR